MGREQGDRRGQPVTVQPLSPRCQVQPGSRVLVGASCGGRRERGAQLLAEASVCPALCWVLWGDRGQASVASALAELGVRSREAATAVQTPRRAGLARGRRLTRSLSSALSGR